MLSLFVSVRVVSQQVYLCEVCSSACALYHNRFIYVKSVRQRARCITIGLSM